MQDGGGKWSQDDQLFAAFIVATLIILCAIAVLYHPDAVEAVRRAVGAP